MSDQTQEARVLRRLLSGRNVDMDDRTALKVGELHMRIKHISEAFKEMSGVNELEPKFADCWRYWPIENIGVTKDGPRPVMHPDHNRHVNYAIYHLPDEYREAMRQVGIRRGWIKDNAPQVRIEATGQEVFA